MGNLFGELMAVQERRTALASQVTRSLERQKLNPALLTDKILDETAIALTKLFQSYSDRGLSIDRWRARAKLEDGKLQIALSVFASAPKRKERK